jgi:rSAM/selenodomain-associated transferase 2
MPANHPISPWLSIIIPTLNEAGTLPACLAKIYTEGVRQEFEVILSDGGSTDKTLAIAATYPALTVVHSTRGRAKQLNAGAKQARGKHLWFLHADTLPPPDWWQHLQNAAARGTPATFSVHFSDQASSALLRFYSRGSKLSHWSVRFGDQSLFVTRALFRKLGGYREDHVLMEGHELARRLISTTGLQVLPAAVTTSSRRYLQFGIVYTQMVFTLIFSLYYLGVGQERLAKLYQKAFR